MKGLFISFVFYLMIASSGFAAPQRTQNQLIDKYNNIVYSIDMPQRVVDGRLIPADTYHIERLSDEFLHPNIIEIKTKVHQYFDNSSVRFDNKIIQNDLDKFSQTKIRAPYAEYFSGNNLLRNDKFGVTRIYEIRFAENHDIYEVCKLLMQNPEIEYATPVYKRYHYGFNPEDTWYSLQYHHARINMPDAWEISQGDTNIVIAIIDSGTDIDHPDLSANIWTNHKEIPNNGKDDDGNGKIDDVNGWDFIGNISINQYQAGQFKENNNPTAKLNTHGTHTAGCASAVTNNGIGVAAPGFKTKLMPIKCASDSFQSPGILRGYEGILYAAVTGAHVINCSWGGAGFSPSEQDVVNQAISLGSLIVAASGNSAKNLDINPDYPAAFKGVMSVGSSGSSDRASNFASYGNLVRVFAPGENIWSTLPNNRYEAQSGTSMASPVAAGVAALVLSIHPDWTPEQVIHQMRGTSDDVLMTTTPEARPLFFGRINAAKALQFNNNNGKSMPGIGVESVVAGTNNAITNYNSNEITISLKNYLSADNIKVKIIPMDNFIDFERTNFDLGKIESMDEHELTANAKLLSNNPWFRGDAEVLLEITGTDYINLELVKIKINMPSENRFTNYADIPSQYGIVWHGSSIVNNDLLYVIGASQAVGGVGVKSIGATRNLFQVNAEPVYAIHAFDANNIIAGDGPSSGLAKVHYSSNSGQSWTTKSVSNITTFINSFNFFNQYQGLMLGDPRGTAWGVGFTNDGGNSWQLVNNIQPALANETGLVGSIFQIGDTVWFGTTAGRIFKTNDKGTSWSVQNVHTGGYITSLSFNENVGVCIYAESSATNAPRFLATTTDGGLTWKKNVYSFTINQQIPLNVYAIKESNSIVVQLYNGHIIASDNDGVSWFPVLTQKADNYNYAYTNQVGNRISIFAAGMSSVSRLDFNFTPSVIRKEVAFVGGGQLEFDSLTVNITKDLSKEIFNSGNTEVAIESITFVPDQGTENTDFRVLLPLPQEVIPSQPATLRVRFQPKTLGFKSGQVVIKSDAVNDEIRLHVTGYATNPSSISDNEISNNLILYPNPASGKISISVTDNLIINSYIIYNNLGNELIKSEFDLNEIDVSKLPVGSYRMKLFTDNIILNQNFIISR